jgi:predicted DNA-binding transcriptional regulator AlpA
MASKELLYLPQIAEMLGVTTKQALRLVESETFPLPPYRHPDGRPALPAWRREDVEAWIARRDEQIT